MSLSDPPNRSTRAGAEHLTVLVGLTVVYYVAATLGLRLASVHPSATPVWAPSGIALAAALVWGGRVWPAIFAGAFLVNLATAGNVVTSAGIAVGNTLEGVLGAYLVRRLAPAAPAFDHTRDVFIFAVVACGSSTMVSATLGVGTLAVAGYAPWHDVGMIWLTWWLGDASGALIVAPALLLWARDRTMPWSRERRIETAALVGGLVTMGQLVFGGVLPSLGSELPLEFLSVPPLLWAAMRFTPREAATATLVLSVIAVRGTLLGLGPFARVGPNDSLLLVQSFMVVSAATTLILAAVASERRRDAAELQRLSDSDGLTGLANYRHFHEALAREVNRFGRTGSPFALLLMDLNGLKSINDRLGHVTGNRALCRVAEAMLESCRVVDLAARFGGDEFAMVLPETNRGEAWAVGARIQRRLAESDEAPPLGLSFGVAEYPHDGETTEALTEQADRVLYAMKRTQGREAAKAPTALTGG
jgi:diguanylate cyclase (GGDEF)-like protein